MIPISRPTTAPADLVRLGQRQTSRDCSAYAADAGAYCSGAKRLAKKTYYKSASVKRTLVAAHRDKCCYCETRVPDPANLHVEHYRPKSGVRQARSDREDELPGYYWLAYEWTNLLLACHACNTTFKSTLFPLVDPARRARSNADSLADEAPLLIDPAVDDPVEHIYFIEDAPVALTMRGRETIAILALDGVDRPRLREDRLALLRRLRAELDILTVAARHPNIPEIQALGDAALDRLNASMQPDAPFSGMATDFVMEAM